MHAERPGDGRAVANFVHTIQVRWADCDPALIAYTGRLPCFALEAIDAWWAAHVGSDWYALNLDHNMGTPFVHLDLDFRSPVTPRHSLECTVVPTRLSPKSITFRVSGHQDGTLCFEGNFVCAFVAADAFKSAPPPETIFKALERLVPMA
jgi:4-hydroxybenzoyl-CoA thioesterase